MQATRGTPLSADDGPAPRHTGRSTDRSTGRSTRRVRVAFALIALTAYTADQLTKALAAARLAGGEQVELIPGLFWLTYVRNPGAAFSLGTQFTVAISIFAIVAVGVVLWLSRRLAGSLLWAVALGLLLAGIAGNLTDRLLRDPGPLRGHVIDFFAVPHWPVFNVADICINLGAALVIVQAFRGIQIDGSPAEDQERES